MSSSYHVLLIKSYLNVLTKTTAVVISNCFSISNCLGRKRVHVHVYIHVRTMYIRQYVLILHILLVIIVYVYMYMKRVVSGVTVLCCVVSYSLVILYIVHVTVYTCTCTSMMELDANTFFSMRVSEDAPFTVAKYLITNFALTVLPAPLSPLIMRDWLEPSLHV